MWYFGTSLAVQWLRLCPSSAGGMGSIPSRGTKILHAVRCGQEKKQRLKMRYFYKKKPLKKPL